ncbi:phosphoethanolamine transferase domain-containing protein [Enterobacter hormaechei]
MLASLSLIAGVAALYYQDYASVGRNNSTLNKRSSGELRLQHFPDVKDTYFMMKCLSRHWGMMLNASSLYENPR